MEVLKPSSRMWLTLLALRTMGLAAERIKRSDHMTAESPDAALALVWEEFDERLSSHPKAAKDLMRELVEFHIVYADNKDHLCRFALACKQARVLMETDHCRELKMLDYPEAQLNVMGRLQFKLFGKWKHYAYKYKEENDESVPFRKFCDWIMRQDKEGSNPDFDRHTPSNSKEVVKASDKNRSNTGACSQQQGQRIRPSYGGRQTTNYMHGGGISGGNRQIEDGDECGESGPGHQSIQNVFTRVVGEPQEQNLAS